ncbi:hypothetical protein [Cyclobacterium sp.]|uniref:hypothetical protein n=1 Tax=Cyclobacterium sp. TaxID=1966343 RepID=UPI00198AC68A|nr:hypothetical protein [Cyclobacterium sp.]MBD3630518.1 hypothetical protein [Cyclobacterium sp.]
MDNLNYLIVITYGLRESSLTRKEVWTDLLLLCQDHTDFDYSFLVEEEFPFEYKGWLFEKLPVNKRVRS